MEGLMTAVQDIIGGQAEIDRMKREVINITSKVINFLKPEGGVLLPDDELYANPWRTVEIWGTGHYRWDIHGKMLNSDGPFIRCVDTTTGTLSYREAFNIGHDGHYQWKKVEHVASVHASLQKLVDAIEARWPTFKDKWRPYVEAVALSSARES